MRLAFQIMSFCISLLFLQPSFVFAQSKLKVGDKVPNFTLEGTDDKQHEIEKMKGKVVVLVFGTRKLDEETDRWLLELHNAFKEANKEESPINIFEVVGDMPRFMSKAVVKKLAKKFMLDKKLPFPKIVLFDWGKKVSKLLGADEEKVNIFVIDKEGMLAHYQVVPYSEENFLVLKGKIEENLKSGNDNNTNHEGGN